VSGFTLNAADKRSPLWLDLAEHLNARLAMARAENDCSRSVEKTEHLRGRIFELKALLALAEDAPRRPD
jgi:hypothetical protein